MSCGIHTGCKLFISVHQCMRNSFNINNEIFICRRFNTLKKTLRPVPSVKFSHLSIERTTIQREQGGSNIFVKKHQLVPLACNVYSNDCKPEVGNQKQPSIYQRFKTMFKQYWYVLIPVHLVTSCFWFGGFYYMAVSGVDIPHLLENLGAPESWIEKFKNTKAGNIVIAYTFYKVMTPLRYTVTIGGCTLSIKHLKRWGWIKPVPNKEELKRMYQGQKDALKDLKAGYQDKMQVTKTGLLKTTDKMKKQFEVAKDEFHKSISEMRSDLKQGVQGGAEEWKIISKALRRDIKEVVDGKKKPGNYKN